MGLPTPSDVHVNAPLTNIAVAYVQDEKNFFAHRIFPVVPVAKSSDRYFTYSKADMMRVEAAERAPATESAGGGWRLDNTPSYSCRKYALHKDVDDDTRANADSVIDMDRDATTYLMQNLLMKRDKVFAANYLTTGVWGTDRTGVSANPTGTQFLQFDQSASDPIGEITADITALAKATGLRPNKLLIGAEVWAVLKNHAQFTDRIKYTMGPAIVTEQLLAQVLGIDEVVVAWSIENTAKEGQTASMSFITGKVMLLCYSAPAPSLLKPSAGYTFSWTGLLGGGANGPRIKKFRMDAIESDRIEAEMSFDMKVVSTDCAIFYTAVVG